MNPRLFALGFQVVLLVTRFHCFIKTPMNHKTKSKLETWEIIGVARDFNFESLRENVGPLGIFFGSSRSSLAFRYETDNTQEVISTLEKKWKAMAPGEPFHYTFLDENFQSLYKTEAKVSKVFALFSGLAIMIACLGLFALTAYTAEQRTKEIGIRKVMGASVQNIILLLSSEFGKLILWGFVLAAPLAAYSIQWYLQDYAYKTHITWWTYVGAGYCHICIGHCYDGLSIDSSSENKSGGSLEK